MISGSGTSAYVVSDCVDGLLSASVVVRSHGACATRKRMKSLNKWVFLFCENLALCLSPEKKIMGIRRSLSFDTVGRTSLTDSDRVIRLASFSFSKKVISV